MVVDKSFLENYNELFKFLHKHGGHNEVIAFWEKLTGVICGELKALVKAKGLAGALEYWSYTLGKEGGDFSIMFERTSKSETLTVIMLKCPSLEKLEKPYERYCQHCEVLYKPIFQEEGYEYNVQYTGEGRCLIKITKG